MGHLVSGVDCFGSSKILGHSNLLFTKPLNSCTGGPLCSIREGISVLPSIANSPHYTAHVDEGSKVFPFPQAVK